MATKTPEGLPSYFNYVVLVAGQDPVRTEAFNQSIDTVVSNDKRFIAGCSPAVNSFLKSSIFFLL